MQTVVWQLFCAGLGRSLCHGEPTPWHWSKHVKFRPSWLFLSGCLCTADKLKNVDHHHQQQHQHAQPSPPFIQHSLSNSFRCSIKFFLGLALGASCVASTTTEKHWCPVSTFSNCRGKAFLGKPATITFGENKDQSWIKFRLLYDNSFAPALGGACAMGNQHHGIHHVVLILRVKATRPALPNMLNSGHHDCSSQAVSARLTNWKMLIIIISSSISTFSLLHLSYNIHWAIAFVVLSCSFLGWPWAHLALLPQQQKNTDFRCLLFPIAVGRLS